MSPIGLNQLGSSRLAGLIAIMPLPDELSAKSGEPQSAQKPRRAVRPLAALTEEYLGAPLRTSTADAGTSIADEKPPPLALWQSRQWQFPMITGSEEHS